VVSRTRIHDLSQKQVLIGFVDPSGLQEHPGWPLRNLLAYANIRLGLQRLNVLCLRDKLAKNDLSSSLILHIELPKDSYYSSDGR
jgi:ubiquitin-like modifier-activating enzyme ATG7